MKKVDEYSAVEVIPQPDKEVVHTIDIWNEKIAEANAGIESCNERIKFFEGIISEAEGKIKELKKLKVKSQKEEEAKKAEADIKNAEEAAKSE